MSGRICLAILIFAIAASISGCRTPVIWRAEAPSPDGTWVASVRTEQNGGFGTDSIATVVSLRRPDRTVNSGKPLEILVFDCPGPAAKAYELDDANAGGTIHLTMKWVAPRRLAVSYDGRATVDLQVVKFSDVEISLQDTSKSSDAAVR
jgi:hypothetical protein